MLDSRAHICDDVPHVDGVARRTPGNAFERYLDGAESCLVWRTTIRRVGVANGHNLVAVFDAPEGDDEAVILGSNTSTPGAGHEVRANYCRDEHDGLVVLAEAVESPQDFEEMPLREHAVVVWLTRRSSAITTGSSLIAATSPRPPLPAVVMFTHGSVPSGFGPLIGNTEL